ncbi:hypothetical protein GCM10009525_08340 [Streptosporangium amethystogenes subsp. fukuiense]
MTDPTTPSPLTIWGRERVSRSRAARAGAARPAVPAHAFDPAAAMESLWAELDRRGISPGLTVDAENGASLSWNALALSEDNGWAGLEGGDAGEVDESPAPAGGRQGAERAQVQHRATA